MKIHSFTSSSNWMSQKQIKIAKSVGFTLVAALFVCAITYFFSDKTSYALRTPFYESKQNYDVLFMGTSHMYDGVYPMELYRDYGISSYNLGVAGERLAMTYYSLKDALENTDARLVVVDLHAIEYGNEKNDLDVPKRMHHTIDAIKNPLIRLDAVNDIVEAKDRADFYFPLTLYHNRWTQLEDLDFKNMGKVDRTKGAKLVEMVANCEKQELIPEDEYVVIQDYSSEYLRKIIDLCGENNIDVLLCYIPYHGKPENFDTQMRCANYGKVIADEYAHVKYTNMFYIADEIGIDYATDTADDSSHLNSLGARKVSRYIGQYIVDNYDIPDSREGKYASLWNNQYQDYVDYKIQKVKSLDAIEEYLMMINDPDFQVFVKYNEGSSLYADALINKLITSINMDESIAGWIPEEDEDDIKVVVVNRYTGDIIDYSTWNDD